ncbi:MAG: hypothetical protein ACLR8P_13435 [Clostridium fessum]
MEKLRELMKEHQDKADKKVMGEVLELLQREPGLFCCDCPCDEKLLPRCRGQRQGGCFPLHQPRVICR